MLRLNREHALLRSNICGSPETVPCLHQIHLDFMSPQSELKVGCSSLTLLPHQKKSLGVYTNSLIGKKKKPSYPNYSVSAISTCHSAYFRCNGYQPQDWKGKEPVTKTDASPWSVRDPVSKPRKGRSWRDGPALCCSGMGTESVPSTPFRLQLPAVPTPWDLMPSLASHDI